MLYEVITLMNPISKHNTFLNSSIIILLALFIGLGTFLALPPSPVKAQGGSTGNDGSLVVTNTVYT